MAPMKRHIKRTRTVHSCQNCRRRKVKCDKTHPVCGECQKTRETCVYDDPVSESLEQVSEVPNPRKRRQVGREAQVESEDSELMPETSELNARISELGSLLERLRNMAGVEREEHQVRQQRHESNKSMPDLQTITSQLALLNDWLRDGLNEYSGPTEQPVSGATTMADSSSFRLVQSPPSTTGPSSNFHTDFIVPSREQVNLCFRSWWHSVYCVLPIFNPYHIFKRVEAFHTWYGEDMDSGRPNPDEASVPIVFAIYYAGLISMSERSVEKWFPGLPRRHMLDNISSQFERSLASSRADVLADIDVLAAQVMMARIRLRKHSWLHPDGKLGQIIRTAQSLDLHRERDLRRSNPVEAERRRRLWWEIVSLDTRATSLSKLPPLIDERFFDTSSISERKDSYQTTPTTSEQDEAFVGQASLERVDDPLSAENNSTTSAIYLVARARYLMTSAIRGLSQIIFGTQAMTLDSVLEMRAVLADIEDKIRLILTRIPTKGNPEFDAVATTNTNGQSFALDQSIVYGSPIIQAEIDSMRGLTPPADMSSFQLMTQEKRAMIAFHRWAHIFLPLMTDQLRCLSYAPLLKNFRSKAWLNIRSCAVKHSHSFLRRYNVIASDLEIERFRWTWPHLFEPMHTAMILLIELFERPYSSEAIISRALLDQTFTLSAAKYGIIGGKHGLSEVRPMQEAGHEAYTMIKELREHVWRKAGLDPAVLWTEDDQIQVGVSDMTRPNDDSPGNSLLPRARLDQESFPDDRDQTLDEYWREQRTGLRENGEMINISELINKIRLTRKDGASVQNSLPNVEQQHTLASSATLQPHTQNSVAQPNSSSDVRSQDFPSSSSSHNRITQADDITSKTTTTSQRIPNSTHEHDFAHLSSQQAIQLSLTTQNTNHQSETSNVTFSSSQQGNEIQQQQTQIMNQIRCPNADTFTDFDSDWWNRWDAAMFAQYPDLNSNIAMDLSETLT